MSIAPGPLAAALVLALVYVVGHRGAHTTTQHVRRSWTSAAAGASVAYVFVDILPELGTHHRAFVASSGGELLFAEQRIYIVALIGFVAFYGLEHMVLNRRTGARDERDLVFVLHVAGFAAYSALVGYLLAPRAEAGWLALVLYTAAMGFHFLVVDHSMGAQHGAAFGPGARGLLSASVLAGWLAGASLHVSEAALARIFAFLAGGVVITSVRAELPSEANGRFWPFSAGAAVYALLLLTAVTAGGR